MKLRLLALFLTILTVLSVFALTGCAQDGDTEQKPVETKAETTKKDEKKNNTPTEFYGTDWINAVEFGMVGDGETANDKKMSEYIRYYAETPLYFPEGVYCFEKTLAFPENMYIELDPAAELKCIAKKPLDFFITVRADATKGGTIDNYSKSYIKGGTINANYCAKTGIATSICYHAQFEGFTLMNVLERGIHTNYNTQGVKQGAFTARDIFIYNDKAIPGTIGIYDAFVDTNVYSTSIVNFETGIYTHGGRFYECTAWVGSAWAESEENFENLTFAQIGSGDQSIFDNCTVDTMRYGFKLADGASCTISNMIWFTNTTFYKGVTQAKYPRTIFYSDNPYEAEFYVVGAQVPTEPCLSFSNGNLPNSAFLNIRGSEKLPYFRNDTGILGSYAVAETTELNGASNYDRVTSAGTYACDLLTGEQGINVPPVKEKGVLEVSEVGDMVTQKFYGTKTSAFRVFDGTAWGEWIIVGA